MEFMVVKLKDVLVKKFFMGFFLDGKVLVKYVEVI